MPMRTICNIELSRSFERLETERRPSQPSAPGPIPNASIFKSRPPTRRARCFNPRLADHVRQQTEEARALDRLGELTLLLGRDRGDAARNDLAALGHVALKQLRVFVVDPRSVGAGERAGLATAEERTASAATGTTSTATLRGVTECHDRYSCPA